MDKIREKPDLTKPLNDADAKQQQERDKQVKILVPNSTAGMIIGKAGAYIKQVCTSFVTIKLQILKPPVRQRHSMPSISLSD